MSIEPYIKGRIINFEPPGCICDMCVNGGVLLILTREGSILRADLADNSEPTEIKIWKNFDKWIISLHKFRSFCLFYSPNNNLICLTPLSKPRDFPLPKSTKLSAVSWTYASHQMVPEKVLMAATNGKIFELDINTQEEASHFGLAKNKIVEICSISDPNERFMILPVIQQLGRESLAVLVVFATNCSVYYYYGNFVNPHEERIYSLLFEKNNIVEVRLGDDHLIDNVWDLYIESGSTCPTALALASQNKILYFGIQPLRVILRYSIDYHGGRIASLTSTKHNVVVLTESKLDIVSIYNNHVLYSHELDGTLAPYIKTMGVAHSHVLWMVSERKVFRYRLNKEDRKVLDILIEQSMYDMALAHVQDDPPKYDFVLDLYSEHLFKTNKEALVKSVDKFARFTDYFEAMALRFVECGDLSALKTFLTKCYSGLEDTVKICALVPWILEVYLNLMVQCRYESRGSLDAIYEELKSFLKNCDENKMIRIKKTLFELIRSHGEMQTLVFLSTVLKDYEELINFHIQQRDYMSAVELIRQPQLDPQLLVKVAPVLFQNVPEMFVEDVIHYLKMQDDWEIITAVIPQLVPAFVSANGNSLLGPPALKFFKTAIEHFKCREVPVHDYYVTLLLEYDSASIMHYLKSQTAEDDPPFSLRQTLFLCIHAHHYEAACFLYELQGLYHNAVLMALESNQLDKAMGIARMSGPEDKDKLFTKIIEWIIKYPGTGDIVPMLVNLVNDGEMELDRILPLIPDDCPVHIFQDSIVNCLKSYDGKIANLHQEIGDIDKMAEKLRSCCSDTLKKRIVVRTDDLCRLCSISAIDRPFYVFPCTHVFHQDCLGKEHSRLMSQIIDSGIDMSWYDQLSAAEDPECVFCSDLFIHMIWVPFNSEEPY